MHDLAYVNSLLKWWGTGDSSKALPCEEWDNRKFSHVMQRLFDIIFMGLCVCQQCRAPMVDDALFCHCCGARFDENGQTIAAMCEELKDRIIDHWATHQMDTPLPSYGIYIYYHPYEMYKIGKAENVIRRMSKHECSAPSLELLHVIETSDLDWTERFIHQRFAKQRRMSNHEYFDLTLDDLSWLFSIKVLEPPRSIDNQLSLLDLL